MSAFSGSEIRGAGAARRMVLAAMVAAGLVAGAAVAAARTHAIADSGETVKRVRVSQHGIVIERASGSDSVGDWDDRSSRRDRLRTRVRTHGPIIEIDEAGT